MKKSVLTMLSVLSVLLFFFLLCFGSLGLLRSLDVVSFPWEYAEAPAGVTAGEEAFPVYTNAPVVVQRAEMGGAISEPFLMSLPFTDTYYLRVAVTSGMDKGAYAAGLYEIWSYGTKYRVHRYHPETGEVEYTAISDGRRVQITSFADASITYEDLSAANAITEMAPIPNFRKLFAGEHPFIVLQAEGEEIVFSSTYMSSRVIDQVAFDRDSGIVLSYRRTHEEHALIDAKVLTLDLNYAVVEYLFSFD